MDRQALFLSLFIIFFLIAQVFSTEEEAFSFSSNLTLFSEEAGSFSHLHFDESSMRIYSFGGYDGTNSHDLIQASTVSLSVDINPLSLVVNGTISYSQKTISNLGQFSVVGKLPSEAYGYAFHVLKINGVDYAYIFGGGTKKIQRATLGNLTNFSELDSDLPYSYCRGASFRTEKKLFLIGGSNSFEYARAVYSANVNTPTIWTRVGSFPKFLFSPKVFSVGRMIYIVGGSGYLQSFNTIYYSSFDELDALSETDSSSTTCWTLSNNVLPSNVFASSQFISSNYAYIFSGYTGMIRASLTNLTMWENVTTFENPYYAIGMSTLSLGNSYLFAAGLPISSSTTNIPYGYLMSITSYRNCFGVAINDSFVCSGHGNCIGKDTCSCAFGFYGDACQYESSCGGIQGSSPNVCSGKGNCLEGGTCSCFGGYSGTTCSNFECNGVSVLNTSQPICSGHGTCIDIEQCSCHPNYYGRICEFYDCFGLVKVDPNVCSGHGSCIAPNQCVCNGTYGKNCSEFQCFGIMSNDSSVCSGFGKCVGSNNCSCTNGYSGEQCNRPGHCDPNSIETPCMGRGQCSADFNCLCEGGYFGNSCELFSCWGISNNESNACSGTGTCINVDTCDCQKTETGYYYGTMCELYFDGSVQNDFEIRLNSSNVNVERGVIEFKMESDNDHSTISYRIWCSNCTDFPFTSFDNSMIVESSEFIMDISTLKSEYSYEFTIQGAITGFNPTLSNIISISLFLPQKLITSQDIRISCIETPNLAPVFPFTNQFNISFLISKLSFNYQEGVNFLLNDCVGYSLENACQLTYSMFIHVYNTSDMSFPIRILENKGSIIVQRTRDVSSLQFNPVLNVNITNPFPYLDLESFYDGSELLFQIYYSVQSQNYSFSSTDTSHVSFSITRPATYPSGYLESVELIPKEGMSVVDTFRISTPEWRANNLNLLPLSYAFGFYNQFLDKSTDGNPSSSSLFRVTEYNMEPIAKLPLPYIFKSLSRNSLSTSSIEIVIFVKDSQGNEQSLRISKALVSPLSVELGTINDYSKYVLAFDQSALSNKNNTNLIVNVISNVNIDVSNADSSLQVLNSISSESSLMSDKKVLSQLSNTVTNFLSNTLTLYQQEIDTYGYVKSSLTSGAKTSAVSLLANIFGSSSSSIVFSQKGMLLIDDEMQKTENMILSFTKLMLTSEIPKVLNDDSEVTSLPYVKFSTNGLNTTFSSFILTRSSRRMKNSTSSSKFLLETEGGNIQLDLNNIVGKYGGFGSNLGLSLVSYERNIRNDNFSMHNQMSSVTQELKYFQNAQVVKLNDLQSPIALQFVINGPSQRNLSMEPRLVSTYSELMNQTINTNGNETLVMVNVTTSILEKPVVVCMYWDDTLMSWEDFGCSLDFYNNETGIAQCSCTHTTKFSTFLQYERMNTTSKKHGLIDKPSMMPPKDPSFILSVQYFQIVIGFFFSVLSMVILFLLLIFRKQQPVQSRMITPFVGMVALLVENLLTSILQKGLFIYEMMDNSNGDMMSVNIVGNVCMVIVNALNITAIFSYLIQVIRFQLMKALYERIKQSKDDSNRGSIKALKLITSPTLFNVSVITCFILNILLWSLFVILVRIELISPQLYIRTTSMTYAGIILLCSLVISITILVDIISTIRTKESNNLQNNTSRIMPFNTINQSEKDEDYIVIQSPRSSLALERRNVLTRVLQLDNPLYFRMEMILFLICFMCCIVQMVSGIVVEEFSKDPDMVVAHYFMVIQFIFETVYSGMYLFVFGGFALLVLLKFKRNKRSIVQNELFEQTELMDVLQDDIGFGLFEEFSKKEFSLENLYLYIELFNNKSIVMGENIAQLPILMDRLNENFIALGSIYEVNIPSYTKGLFNELYKDIRSKGKELLSNSKCQNTSDNALQCSGLDLIVNDTVKKETVHSLSEDEEKILKAKIIACFDSLIQQIMINMNDTYYRFAITPTYKNYRKNREMILTMAKQANIISWQEPNLV